MPYLKKIFIVFYCCYYMVPMSNYVRVCVPTTLARHRWRQENNRTQLWFIKQILDLLVFSFSRICHFSKMTMFV